MYLSWATLRAERKEARTASHAARSTIYAAAVDGGRTRGGEKLRLLTKDGLASAAIELDRGQEEMGGMPKSVGRSGASHAMTVNETAIAMIRPKPDLHLVAGQPAEAIAAAQACRHARRDRQHHLLRHRGRPPGDGHVEEPRRGRCVGGHRPHRPGGGAAAAVHRDRQLL
ncbi:hypothetical protein [Streptomyces capitiformicae]|nr:hypothetical protein [Streptomyces capitiformicae]